MIAFILFFVFWLIGLIVTSFTLIPILIIFAFGIPTTHRLEKLQVLKTNNGIIKRYFVTLIILLIVFLTMIMIIKSVFPNGLIGILFGGGMVVLLGLGQIGINDKNIIDYLETNKELFTDTPEVVRHVILGWK